MAERIRVMVISEPGKAGVKRHVIDLLRRIDLDAFDVYFVYSFERSDAAYAGEIAELESRGMTCLEIPMDAPLSVKKDSQAFKTLVREMRRIRPHVVHLHSSKAGGLGRLAALCVRPRPRVVYTPHAMACHRSRFYWGIEVVLGLMTDRTVAVSKSEQADWVRWKIPKAQRAAVIPHGFESPSVPLVDHREIPAGTSWSFGACGRICRQKNALLMFQTALEMLRRDAHARFVWIGDFSEDEEAQAVKQLLDEAGNPERLAVTGWVSDPEKRMRELDVFCMISRYEGLSYVLAEAQLLRLPVVGVDAPGVIDLIQHDQTGVIAAPQVDALCDALITLRDDRELRSRLGESARQELVLNYSFPKMVGAIEGVYRDMSRRGKPSVESVHRTQPGSLLEQGRS